MKQLAEIERLLLRAKQRLDGVSYTSVDHAYLTIGAVSVLVDMALTEVQLEQKKGQPFETSPNPSRLFDDFPEDSWDDYIHKTR